MNQRTITRLGIISAVMLFSLMCLAPTFFPEGNQPLITDNQYRSLIKINDLLYSGTSVASAVTQSGTWSVNQSGTWNVNAVQSGAWNVNSVQSGAWNVNAVQSGVWAIGTTNSWTQATILSTNVINAVTGTPVVMGVAGTTFKSVTFIGKKAPKSANQGTVYIQIAAGDDTNSIPVIPNAIITIEAPLGSLYNAAQFWLDVDTANDGVTAFYFN